MMLPWLIMQGAQGNGPLAAQMQQKLAGGVAPNPMLGGAPAQPQAPNMPRTMNPFMSAMLSRMGGRMVQPQTPQSVTQAPGWGGNANTIFRPMGSSYGG